MRSRKEFFRISKYGRRYDRRTGCFIVDIAYSTGVKVSPRTVAVSEAFGVGGGQEQKIVCYV